MEKDLPEGTVVITDYQYRGRGQGGNVWYSEPHKNLTFSVILYPTSLRAQQNFALNIITTLAIQQALSRYVAKGLAIKWPNDIYHQDKKLCGVLIENIVQKQHIRASVVGIGLNINQMHFPRPGPTSLALVCGRTCNLQELLAQVLNALERIYLQFQAHGIVSLKAAYLKSMYWMHEPHTFRDQKQTFQGKIVGIDAVGQLAIEQVNGTVRYYNIKEVIFVA